VNVRKLMSCKLVLNESKLVKSIISIIIINVTYMAQIQINAANAAYRLLRAL